MTANRNDGRAGFDGEAHEAKSELGELVALIEGLGDAARPLWEYQERFPLRQEALRIFGNADHLTDPRKEQGDERQRDRPLLDHRTNDARRFSVHE